MAYPDSTTDLLGTEVVVGDVIAVVNVGRGSCKAYKAEVNGITKQGVKAFGSQWGSPREFSKVNTRIIKIQG